MEVLPFNEWFQLAYYGFQETMCKHQRNIHSSLALKNIAMNNDSKKKVT